MTDSVLLRNELWRYSLTVYAYEPLQQWLLDRQNRWGANVNLLLCHGWLSCDGKGLTVSQWRQLGRQLQPWVALTEQWRQRRVQLKSQAETNSQALRLRRQVARAELLSEQYQQALMYRYCHRHCRLQAVDWQQWLAAFGWPEDDQVLQLFARAQRARLSSESGLK